VKDRGVLLGGTVAPPLLGEDVQQDRAVQLLDFVHGMEHLGEIVAVDRTEITEAEPLKEDARHDETLEALFHAARSHTDARPHALEFAGEIPDIRFDLVVQGIGNEVGEIFGHGADIARDRHAVVIDDDNDVFPGRAGIVQPLVGQPPGKGAVADDSDHLKVLLRQIARAGDAESRGYGGAGVADAKGIVGALAAFGETADSPILADAVKSLTPAGDDLVGVGLMADIPDDLVLRGIQDMMEGEGQFDHAERWGKVAPGLAGGLNNIVADLPRQLGQLGDVKILDIRRRVDLGKQFIHK